MLDMATWWLGISLICGGVFWLMLRHEERQAEQPPAPVYPLDLYRNRSPKLRADCPRRGGARRRDGGRATSPTGRPALGTEPGRPTGTGDAA